MAHKEWVDYCITQEIHKMMLSIKSLTNHIENFGEKKHADLFFKTLTSATAQVGMIKTRKTKDD